MASRDSRDSVASRDSKDFLLDGEHDGDAARRYAEPAWPLVLAVLALTFAASACGLWLRHRVGRQTPQPSLLPVAPPSPPAVGSAVVTAEALDAALAGVKFGLLAGASVSCKAAPNVGWPTRQCVSSTVSASNHSSCPLSLLRVFHPLEPSGHFPLGKTQRMGCKLSGNYEVRRSFAPSAPGLAVDTRTVAVLGAFNRTSAFEVTRKACQAISWTHGLSERRGVLGTTHGPAIVGTDKDIGRALSATRESGTVRGHGLQSVSLLHLGMEYSRRAKDGMWTPCTNLAFMQCALRGYLRGQGGSHGARFFLATAGKNIGRRCRPCGACNASRPSFDECAHIEYTASLEFVALYVVLLCASRSCASISHAIPMKSPCNYIASLKLDSLTANAHHRLHRQERVLHAASRL